MTWFVALNFNNLWFALTSLMAYSRAKMKSSDNKSSPPFRPFLIGNHHHPYHHHISVMELGHLLTCSSLTYPEVSSKVCHDPFCQLGNSFSLPWVIYYKAFYLYVVRCILMLHYTPIFQVTSFPQVSPPKTCMHLTTPHNCHMPPPQPHSYHLITR